MTSTETRSRTQGGESRHRVYKPSRPERQSTAYHLHTIWLVTANDIKSIVLPETAFGIFTALAGAPLIEDPSPTILSIFARLPHVLLWNWLNVLLFDIANQRLPASILEDSVNKSWRPLPTGRLTPDEARRLLLAVVPLVFGASLWLGGMREAVAMMVLTWMYNDLGGADELYVVRNAINALGFMCYSSGATEVAVGGHGLTRECYHWVMIVGAIVFTTLSMQDLPDVIGDAARMRRTSPLVMGDSWCRWEIALPIFAWSVICPLFWNVNVVGFLVPLSVGLWLGFRVLCLRTVAADRVSWRIWCLWTGVLYALPLFKTS